jgi:hypothetical protein
MQIAILNHNLLSCNLLGTSQNITISKIPGSIVFMCRKYEVSFYFILKPSVHLFSSCGTVVYRIIYPLLNLSSDLCGFTSLMINRRTAVNKKQHVVYHTISFLELEFNKHQNSSGLVTCDAPTFMYKLRYEGKKRFYKKRNDSYFVNGNIPRTYVFKSFPVVI